MNKISVFLMLFFFGIFFVSGQKVDQCLSDVLMYNKRIAELGKPKEGKVYFMDYRQEIRYWDGSISPVDMRVKYYVSKNQVHTISDKLKTYMDDDYVFTIIEDQKQIIVTKNPKDEVSPDAMKLFLNNQKMILEKCDVIECSNDREKNTKKIVLDATKTGIKGFHGDKMTYYFDFKGNLKKTISTYTRAYSIRRMAITINEMNFNSSYKFPEKLYDMFLDSKGKLKSKFAGYQLITE
jgi:hypothetical protein